MYCVLGTVVGAGNIIVRTEEKAPVFMELTAGGIKSSAKHISSRSRSGYGLESDDGDAVDFMRNTLPPAVCTDPALPQSALPDL